MLLITRLLLKIHVMVGDPPSSNDGPSDVTFDLQQMYQWHSDDNGIVGHCWSAGWVEREGGTMVWFWQPNGHKSSAVEAPTRWFSWQREHLFNNTLTHCGAVYVNTLCCTIVVQVRQWTDVRFLGRDSVDQGSSVRSTSDCQQRGPPSQITDIKNLNVTKKLKT